MIKRVRFDDVLWVTSDKKIHGKELQKFQKHINWCEGLDVTLSPAILCQDIEKIEGGVEYIKKLMDSDQRVQPDLHGWDHGPYGERSQGEIEEHLDQAYGWFLKNLDCVPTRWVTPHGANNHVIQAAARSFSLVVEDTSHPVVDQKQADTILRETKDTHKLDDRVIMVHWWERGLRLYRIAKILQLGSVDRAIEVTKHEVDEKTWRICWNGWNE